MKEAGGSIDAKLPSFNMLTATVPMTKVAALAERDDVSYVVPNRDTHRTASLLENSTGAITSPVRSSSTKTTYTGLDGSGVGIAVVDSGVMKAHKTFKNTAGNSRVAKNVQFLTTAMADWTNGYDDNFSPPPRRW